MKNARTYLFSTEFENAKTEVKMTKLYSLIAAAALLAPLAFAAMSQAAQIVA